MIVSVEVPDQFAKQFHLDDASQSRALLEAFLLQRYAERELSASQVGQILGFSFQETEEFLHDHGAPPNVTPEEHLRDFANLERFTDGDAGMILGLLDHPPEPNAALARAFSRRQELLSAGH